MGIKLQGLETDLKVNTDSWNAGFKGAIAGAATLIAGVAALGAGIKKMVDVTFEWAGEMDSIQDIVGGTSEEAAALNFVLHKSGVETEKFTAGMVILEKGLVDANGELDTSGKKLAQFGINVLDANGKVKDQAQLIKEISNKYNSFSTQQERVNFLTEVFGKSGAGLIDVFDTLASEGGLDATTDKVKKFGLAIEPAKYEKFQRNLEEIKLAGLGLAITVVDNLMPAVEGFTDWWQADGLPATTAMVRWLSTNIPAAVNNTRNTWTLLTGYLKTNANPVMAEVGRLSDNVGRMMNLLGIHVDTTKAKWNVLMIAMSPAIVFLHNLKAQLNSLADILERMNNFLERGISFWERLRDVVTSFSIPSISLPDLGGGDASAGGLGSASGGKKGGGGGKKRATGGAVLAGQSYMVHEGEIFTPNKNGTVDKPRDMDMTALVNALSERDNILVKKFSLEIAKALG